MATRRSAKSSKRSGKASKSDQAKLVPPTRQTGPETATGMALRSDAHEVPTGKDRGSKTPIQTKEPGPALFTSNGQLPHNMVPTATGPQPVGAVSSSQEDADRRMEEVSEKNAAFLAAKTEPQHKKISEATVNRLGRAELLAIGAQRGYELSDVVGTRTTRQSFLREQAADKNIVKGEEL